MHLETLLIVVIIIMLFIQYDRMHHKAPAPVPAPVIVQTPAPVSKFVDGREQFDQYANERTANQDNIDYYQTCTGGDSARAPCTDPCSSDLEYAVHEYGGEGVGYAGWALAQNVDPQVIQNHSEFVKDRLENSKSSNITGRTYSPSTHDSYNEIPWQGIRGRPQSVKICNPQMMPEANQAVYASEQRITWKSS
jgi:hypothetical protein